MLVMVSILVRVAPNLTLTAAEARLDSPDERRRQPQRVDRKSGNGLTTYSRNGLTIAVPAAHAVLKKELGI
ncbi:MAG: hypothetical protein EOQ50_07345 [Mesorhizobium sp.]|uniref:hypothetical protein n=1 Tax=Mesorhizobium sp. TaxID=1871066 RepID=UPI000FE778D7|nr:hypothetical protein [Mesorhizobium sp.]RWB77842.1 MAG: hypothetical protein EOQ50_07345 [Mesorhizobium sp.]